MAKKVLYIGTDEHYWGQLQAKLSETYKSEEFEYKMLFKKEMELIQKLINPIIDFEPDILFIDYTPHPPKMLTLARTLRRCLPHLRSMIGLWDYLSTGEQIDESNNTGVFINHIKSGEFSEILYQCYMLSMDSEVTRESLAKVNPEDPLYWELSHPMKVGYMTNEYLHIEHDIDFAKGEVVKLDVNFFPRYPVSYFKVKEKVDKNFYYHFRRNTNFKIDYSYKPPIPTFEESGDPESDKAAKEEIQRMKAAQSSGLHADEKKHIVDKWFKKNTQESFQDRTRLLIIDHHLNLLKQTDEPIDSFPFSIRYYNDIDHSGDIVPRVMPEIIVYNFFLNPNNQEKTDNAHANEEAEDSPQVPIESNEESNEDPNVKIDGLFVLELILKKVNEIEDYNPFILVSSSPYTSEDLKQRFGYEHIMCDSSNFDLQKVLRLSEAYEKRKPAKKVTEQRYYFDKNSNESVVHFKMDVFIKELTESFVVFESSHEIPPYTILEMSKPFRIAMTVIPPLDGSVVPSENGFEYFCCLHGLGEKDRADLRVYINQLIFVPKTKERVAEGVEFEQKKVDFLEQKLAAEKAAQEEAEAEAKAKAEEEAEGTIAVDGEVGEAAAKKAQKEANEEASQNDDDSKKTGT